jgi:hypothetical protein
VQKVRDDLKAAYGEPPETTERLLQMAELRSGARLLGVRSISVRGSDVIIRTTDGPKVAAALEGSPARVTVLPVSRPDEIPEVYFRPHNPEALEPATLLAILRFRLAGVMIAEEEAGAAPVPPSAPPVKHSAPPGAGRLRDLKRITKRK